MQRHAGPLLFLPQSQVPIHARLLIAPLYSCKDTGHFSPYLRMCPTNWTRRHDARSLDSKGFREFLRYIENNVVADGLARRPGNWPWSSAAAHLADADPDDLLTLDHWRQIFGNPATIAHGWQIYLNGPARRRNTTPPDSAVCTLAPATIGR